MNESVFLKIYHKMDLSKLQECKIFHKMNLSKSQKMGKLLQNELKKIAKMRHIKNYKNMSREELLISLLKTEQSIVELRKSKDNNAEKQKRLKQFLMN